MACATSPPTSADLACLRRQGDAPAPAHAGHGARPGPGLHRPGPRHRRRAGGALLPRAALRPGGPRLAGARPLPALDRALLDRALGGAGRGRHHPGRGARHLRRRRQPARHVDARHDARRRDDRRLARPRPRPGGRPGARPAARRVRRRASSSSSRTARCRRARPGRRRCRPATSASTASWRWSTATASRPTAPIVLDIEPVADKWRAFGWETVEIDGNDMAAIVDALTRRAQPQRPPEGDRAAHLAGQGRADASRRSEKAHFFRVDVARVGRLIAELETQRGEAIRCQSAGRTLAMGEDEAAARGATRRGAVRPGAGRARPRRGPRSSG